MKHQGPGAHNTKWVRRLEILLLCVAVLTLSNFGGTIYMITTIKSIKWTLLNSTSIAQVTLDPSTRINYAFYSVILKQKTHVDGDLPEYVRRKSLKWHST